MRSTIALAACGLFFLSGCSIGPPKGGLNQTSQSPLSAPVTGPKFTGSVHGGQQPLSGASIQLFAAGATGYGAGASARLSSAVTTDSQGNFAITGSYTCPSPSSLLYIVATQGDPGLGTGTNSAIALAAALGPCNYGGSTTTLNPSQYVVINEVTTVAAVYSLAQFWAPNSLSVGTSSTNAAGLTNAFAIAATLASTSTGSAYAVTPSGGSTVPQTQINTLADILAACVNSAGPTGLAGDPCTTLFSGVQPQNSAAPTNTIAALLDIALNPGTNLSTLFGIIAANAPFQPALSAAPADFALALNAQVPNVDGFSGIAIDAAGNAWVPGLTGTSIGIAGLFEFSPTGDNVSGATGYTGGGLNTGFTPAIAIDPSTSNLWILDNSPRGITEFSNSGTPLTSTPISFFFHQPPLAGIAISSTGAIWVSNQAAGTVSSSILVLDATGALQNGPNGYAWPGPAAPTYIALDSTGAAWVTNILANSSNGLQKYSAAGTLLSPSSGYGGGGLYYAVSLATDAANHVWALNEYSFPSAIGSLSEFDVSGNPLSPSTGFTDSNYYPPISLAIDGDGNPWVLTELRNVFKVNPAGQTVFVLHQPMNYYDSNFMAIDAAGTIWMVNVTGGAITRFIGAAAPVVTPLGANNLYGQRP